MKKAEARRLARACWASDDATGGDENDDPIVSTVCRLWAGMGHIYRISSLPAFSNRTGDGLTVRQECEQQTRGTRSMMVKAIRLPSSSPRSPLSLGDSRKAQSYHVEANFYQQVAKELLALDLGVPRPLLIEHRASEILICMSEVRGRSLAGDSVDDVRKVLSWMATFHSLYWGDKEASAIVERAGLQPVGSYWHLDTRPDEHSSMPQRGLSGRLKLAARAIDRRLKSGEWQCLIHGDPKDANILIDDDWSGGGSGSGNNGPRSENVGKVYLYDFQYCGKGPPTKDLAYFLCSSVDDSALDTDSLVRYYHEQLESELGTKLSSQSLLAASSPGRRIPTLEELQDSLDLAFCDFYRFLYGWGHWGSLNHVEERVRRALDRCDGGTRLESPEDYEVAIERAY